MNEQDVKLERLKIEIEYLKEEIKELKEENRDLNYKIIKQQIEEEKTKYVYKDMPNITVKPFPFMYVNKITC